MGNPALVKARLVAQGLAEPAHVQPADVVADLGAMQGQDLPGLLSSIALRLGPEDGGRPNSNTSGRGTAGQASVRRRDRMERVTEAFNTGRIVRGYPMRGTVFALPAEDAAWVTELCAGPQRRAQAKRWERLGIKPAHVERAREIFAAEAARCASAGAESMAAEAASGSTGSAPSDPPAATSASAVAPSAGVSRARLAELWAEAGVLGESGSAYSLISGMLIDGVAIYGPMDGRHHLVVPTTDWLPTDSDLESRFNGDRVAATAVLLRRYLNSHGPAALRDFHWWTKLPQKLIKPAFDQIAGEFEPAPPELLEHGSSHGQDVDLDTPLVRMGLPDTIRAQSKDAHRTFLLPGFDEIVLGYADRLAFMTPDHHDRLVPGNNGMFRKTVVRGGKFIGMWTAPRSGKAKGATTSGGRKLELDELAPLSQAARRDVERAFKHFPHTE